MASPDDSYYLQFSNATPFQHNFVLQALGVTTTTHNRDVILNSDVIVLATKPHQILGIMAEIQAMFSDFQSRAQPHTSSPKSWRPLIVSVASSITIADIEQKVLVSTPSLFR